jgi:riboflavin kinase/FMN adenylyltransferase
VATIGNFDGVHIGHLALIRRATERAKELGLPSLVVTFDPHPAQILTEAAPLALGSLEQRLELFEEQGADISLVLPFTPEFAAVPAADFCRNVLADALGARELFVGHDFRLGRDQADADALAGYGADQGFRVTKISAVRLAGQIVGSSLIRRKLAEGELALANAMLGRPHAVRGTVVRGLGRGDSVLGVPTANLDTRGLALPLPAVYATSARLPETDAPGEKAASRATGNGSRGLGMPAVTSFGRNPTFGGAELTLETHILDFTGDIYGQTLEVAFMKELRKEKKFAGPEELAARLRADMDERRAMARGGAFTDARE